jgi:hypothetical protein
MIEENEDLKKTISIAGNDRLEKKNCRMWNISGICVA